MKVSGTSGAMMCFFTFYFFFFLPPTSQSLVGMSFWRCVHITNMVVL